MGTNGAQADNQLEVNHQGVRINQKIFWVSFLQCEAPSDVSWFRFAPVTIVICVP